MLFVARTISIRQLGFFSSVHQRTPYAKEARPPPAEPEKLALNPLCKKNQLFRASAPFFLDKVPGAIVSKPSIVRLGTGTYTSCEKEVMRGIVISHN